MLITRNKGKHIILLTILSMVGFVVFDPVAQNSVSAQIRRTNLAQDQDKLMTPVIDEFQELISSDRVASDEVGLRVSIDGDTAVVGAQLNDENGTDSGALSRDIASLAGRSEQNSVNLTGTDQGSTNIFDVLSGVHCQPVQPDLLAWWTGDGNSLDVRNRNNGTLNNGATYGTGKVGTAFDLDGVNDSIDVGLLSETQNAEEITVMAWVRRQNTGTSVGGIIGKWDTSVNNDNSFLLYNGEAATTNFGRFTLKFDDNSGTGIAGTTLIPFDTWTHIAATWRNSDGQMVIYKNGVPDGTLTGAGVGRTIFYHTAFNAEIGYWRVGGSSIYNWDGLIDEPAIFTRALTASEIQQIANADGHGKCKPTATTNPNGLVGWWAGDGDAKDVDGNEDGTLQNGAGFAVSKVGQGFKFDGTDDYVSIPDSPANSVSTAITIEGWTNPSTAPATFGTILSKYDSPTSNFGYAMSLASDQRIQFGVYGNGTGTIQYVVSSVPTIPLNQYTHVTGTFDAATQSMKIYIDGAEVAVSTISNDNVNPIFDSASEVRIGAINIVGGGSTDQHFEGELDEISLYNAVLTATEVKSIFDAGLAGKLKSVATSSTPVRESAKGRTKTDLGSGVISQVGDATITFNSVTNTGTTQQIPFDVSLMPALPGGIVTGLQYDIASSASYSGDIDICFNLPAFTTAIDFAGLRVLHLENDVWQNQTTTSDFATRTLCSTVTTLSPFAIIKFASTAAHATISGRVFGSGGQVLPRAVVSMIDPNGTVRTVNANQFGYYRFDDVGVGQVYTFEVRAKQHIFAPQVINVVGDVLDLDFTAN